MQFRQHRDTDQKRPTRYFSNKQETQVAKAIGGRKVANSGATRYDKGDVCTDKVLVECKTKMTDSKSMSIQKEWLDKLREESIYMKKPFYTLVFNFGEHSDNYYVIPEGLYLQLLDKINSGEIE